jgi:hypothetical protein
MDREVVVDLNSTVGKGDASRTHAPAREIAPHTSPPPLHTDSESERRTGIHGVCKPGVSE